MNQDWKLISRGLLLALIGFGGMALFIVGLSNLFVGKNEIGFVCLVGALLVLFIFRKQLTSYLESLEEENRRQ